MLQSSAQKLGIYASRDTRSGILHSTLIRHFSEFVRELSDQEKSLPEYVEKEFKAYLDCGILDKGFLLLQCEKCNQVQRVAFSCKRRGFCPSCIGKRMNEGSAFFVENVFPKVPVRQWVLSFPMPVRFWMARNPRLTTSLLSIFMRAVHGYYRKSVLRTLNPKNGHLPIQTGSLTVIQRFGSAINLNIHYHALFLDGGYVKDPDGSLRWIEASPKHTEEIQEVLETIQRRMIRHLQKRGLVARAESENGGEQSMDESDPVAQIQGDSVLYKKIRKVGSLGVTGDEAFMAGHLAAILAGFSLHASVHVEQEDRERLEQLCRYLLRPPISEKRLKKLPGNQLLFEMKTTWGDGTRAILLTPKELIQKIVAIIPQPRIHQVRFHGILAPHAQDRSKVVPRQEPQDLAAGPNKPRRKCAHRLSWAELLRRTFQVDLTLCGLCGGKVRFLKTVIRAEEIKSELSFLGIEPTLG